MELKISKEILLIIGIFSLLIALILNLFRIQEPLIEFLNGLFIGISLTTNIGFLLKFRSENYENKKK
jgi:hypothetical protein